MIVNAAAVEDELPGSIEAIFCMLCGGAEERSNSALSHDAEYVRKVHTDFLRTYGLDAREFPLVRFDPTDWSHPFRDVPPGG